MLSLKNQFESISKLNPFWSSWICLCETLQKTKTKDEKTIRKNFNKLVDKNDWKGNSKQELLGFLTTQL